MTASGGGPGAGKARGGRFSEGADPVAEAFTSSLAPRCTQYSWKCRSSGRPSSASQITMTPWMAGSACRRGLSGKFALVFAAK